MARTKRKKTPRAQVRVAQFPQATAGSATSNALGNTVDNAVGNIPGNAGGTASNNTAIKTIAVIGGGASGLAAACAAAAQARTLQGRVRVIVLEQGRKIGVPIMRSGNGRCNFSHRPLLAEEYNAPEFVGATVQALESAFDASALNAEVADEVIEANNAAAPTDASVETRAPWDVRDNAPLRWFDRLGLVWREDPKIDGLLFPFSNKASSVLEVVQAELDRLGVEIYCDITVKEIDRTGDAFTLQLRDSNNNARSAQLMVDAVIVSVGGGTSLLESPTGALGGLPLKPSVPVLAPIKTDTRYLGGLDGVRASVRLDCPARDFVEEGELLFRPYGISGIVVFNASRFVQAGDAIYLDFIPAWSSEQARDFLIERLMLLASAEDRMPTYAELMRGFLSTELAEALIAFANDRNGDVEIVPSSAVTKQGAAQLALALKNFELIAEGVGDANLSQVTRGGIALEAVSAETMQLLAASKLYVCGEALDVDGPCGGYNLHWAWTSGLLAGLSLVRALGDDETNGMNQPMNVVSEGVSSDQSMNAVSEGA